MSVPILIKRSSVAGKEPATSDLTLGELAVNTTDGKLFLKKSVSGVETVVQVSGSTAAAEITGSTLSANVTASSLTSVGTLSSLVVTNNITTSGTITSSALGGFASSTYALNQRNPIWRFTDFPDYGISFLDATAGADSKDTFAIHTGNATAAGSTLTITDGGILRIKGNQLGQRAFNFNWLQDTLSPQKAYKLATLPASAASTYDHIRLEGVIDQGWLSTNKYPFLLTASNRETLSVRYVYGPSIPIRIDFYQEVSGAIGVYVILPANTFGSISVDLIAFQATVNNNISDVINPTGTLVWSSQTRRSAFNATLSESAVDSYLDAPTVITSNLRKSGTTGTGDIGQSTNKFGTVYATTFSGLATTAQYADLAEMYSADADYEPGTVLVFGGEEEVTVTNQHADARVAGVVSTAPAYLMNSTLETGVAVALRGRVPVKVIGQVAKGDLLVASATPGYAVSVGSRVDLGAAVFAKALGNKATSDAGVIEAAVL